MNRITTCPSCGSDKIKRVRRNWSGRSDEESHAVPNLEYYECPDCGECLYDPESPRKIEAHSHAYAKPEIKEIGLDFECNGRG